ncbi:MAG: ATP-binding protein [Bacteroidales bacterium]|nr:ATP-binding protein [Bacteroidales bacterium]
MHRDIYKTLNNWKLEEERKPLLFRGARQVGKTYIIEQFGKENFSNIISINFERNIEYKNIFKTFDPKKIIEEIALISGKKIIIGKTLIFFDEIQECPKAITALRYFYEEMNDIHIIAAGSLLDFALKEANLHMPVGRIQYIYLKPLSFNEFLRAIGEEIILEYISDATNIKEISEAVHDKLIGLLKNYFVIGGMPAVVKEYINSGNISKCQRIQSSIIDTYADDFYKYANKTKIAALQKVFKSAASMVGQKFVYSHVDNTMKSNRLKEAVEMLETAGILIRIKRSNGDGIPIEANAKDNYYKLLFLDVGLLHNMAGIYDKTVLEEDIAAIFKGAVAEQFVGQEIAANQDFYRKSNLYYWAREARNSSAEIDYIFEHKGEIIPVEVKSGKNGKLRSLKMYIDKYKPKTSLKLSQNHYNQSDNITSIPLYAISTFLNLRQ